MTKNTIVGYIKGMIKTSLILRSSISSRLLKKTLFQGFAIAFLGILALAIGAILIPLDEMQKWGWILFIFCLSFIVIGHLPYRRLVRLQMKPDELVLTNLRSLIYFSKGKKILTAPLASVARWSYIQHPKHYGIAAWLKKGDIGPVIIHRTQEGNRLRKNSWRMHQADLFFPYFNQRSFDELLDGLKEEENEENVIK